MENRLATAYGREKGNFIAGMERRVPRGEFLIARGDQRRAKACEFGMLCSIVREKRFDRRTIGKLNRIFRMADNFFESPEEEHFDPRGLYRETHWRIVTRKRVPDHSRRS
jgi:hypothetical protein